jgi:hypothetical protein
MTGKPRLRHRALGLGLAGGLLGELVLRGIFIRVWRGLVIPGGGPSPADALTHTVLGAVAGDGEHLLARDWLLFLARTSADDVATRLVAAGFLTRARTAGRWLGRSPRWVPADPDSAYAALVRVKTAVDACGPVPVQHVLLGRLGTACGLGHQMSLYLPLRPECIWKRRPGNSIQVYGRWSPPRRPRWTAFCWPTGCDLKTEFVIPELANGW